MVCLSKTKKYISLNGTGSSETPPRCTLCFSCCWAAPWLYTSIIVQAARRRLWMASTVRSRANGNSSKWECSQKNHAEWLKMGTFLVKWDSFEHSNAPKHQNGKPISLQVIREQMGIRANGNILEISCNWSLNGIPFARERTVNAETRGKCTLWGMGTSQTVSYSKNVRSDQWQTAQRLWTG